MSNPKSTRRPRTAPTIAAMFVPPFPFFSPVEMFTPFESPPVPDGNPTLPVGMINTDPFDKVVVTPPTPEPPPLCEPFEVFWLPEDPVPLEPEPPPFELDAFPLASVLAPFPADVFPFPPVVAPLLLLLLPPWLVVPGFDAGVVAGAGAGVGVGDEGFGFTPTTA